MGKGPIYRVPASAQHWAGKRIDGFIQDPDRAEVIEGYFVRRVFGFKAMLVGLDKWIASAAGGRSEVFWPDDKNKRHKLKAQWGD
eukprot:11196356-Lingulodinium_polyedra.AAC.1